MSEYPNEEEQLTDPKPSGQSTGDDNLRGDAGDQGNDIRFAEEEALIREQASPASLEHNNDGEYTDRDDAESAQASQPEGEYTDRDDADRAKSSQPEGEYTDRDDADGAKPAQGEGGYTDAEGTQD